MNDEKARLLAELELARGEIARQAGSLAQRANPASLVKNSLRRHAPFWAAGAIIAGFATVRVLFRPRAQKNSRDSVGKTAKTGKILALIAMPLLSVARKAALSYATKQFQHFMQAPSNTQRHL